MVDWAPWVAGEDKNEFDDFLGEQDDGDTKFLDRDSVLFLIDCGPSMFQKNPDGEIPFANAIVAATMAYKDKIISNDRDLLGVCLYATQHKRNQFEFPHVYMFHDLDVPDAVRIRELEALLDDVEEFERCVGHCTKQFPLSEALWTAQHIFTHLPKNIAYKRVFLFTNDENPPKGDVVERRKCIERAKDMVASNVSIELFACLKPRSESTSNHAPHSKGPDSFSSSNSLVPALSLGPTPTSRAGTVLVKGSTTGKSSSPSGSLHGQSGLTSSNSGSRGSQLSQGDLTDPRYERFDETLFWKHLIFVREDEYTGSITNCTAKTLAEIIVGVRKRAAKKRAQGSFNIVLAPGPDGRGLELAVELYNPIMRATNAKYALVDADTNLPIKVESRLLCAETGAELGEEDLEYYVEYGGTRVTFDREEVRKIKTQFGGPGLKLLGFKDARRLKVYHNDTHSSFIYPNEKAIKGSAKLFWALHIKMRELGKIAIGMLIPRNNAQPRFVALLPQAEVLDPSGGQVEPPGMVVIDLPFADDLRELNLDTVTPASDPQIQAAKKVISRLTIEYDPNEFENPALQRHYSALQALALEHPTVEEKEDLTEPDLAGMGFHSAAIDSFRKLVYPEDYDPRTSAAPEKRKWEGEAGAAKKPRAEVEIGHIDFVSLAATDRLENCTQAELKEYCRAKGLTVSGKKAELGRRIKDYLQQRGKLGGDEC
eukprot:TRINITY_DN3503_c0_g1_i1.p1 TRINITY_DN3503_c0_g1~~TRINITY_DN3503_c0_g1_i1.p1  ORF type:complete len:719 (-),score=114.09 TRINITY_DN3503_c0_g1_i1:1235-3367(-)